MAFTRAHIYLRALGAFGTAAGTEKWSSGLRFFTLGGDVPYDESNLLAFANSAHAAFLAFHANTQVSAGSACYFVNCSAARIGTDGKYDPLTQDTQFSTGSPQAGGSATNMPWNTAHVISLRTDRPRGYASNGRLYWPATALTITGSTGRLTATAVQNRLAAARTMINALNAAANTYATDMKLGVMSSVGNGAAAFVTGIRADDRLDSIERRENAAPPTWQTSPIP